MEAGFEARRLAALGGVIAIVGHVVSAGDAAASAMQPSLQIPSAPMGEALTTFGKQTGSQILFLPEIVAAKRSRPVSGRYRTDDGLRLLLEGSGLTFRYTGDGVYLVERVETPLPQSSSQPRPVASKDGPPTVVVVRGYRSALAAAAAIRQQAIQIVDAVVATDIGKLPDDNAAEALQRIGGVQISRNQGEGGTVTVRGMTQIRSELDGRSIFTPSSGGRSLNFEDIPSELLAGIEVHKTPSADQVEGGLSGVINLRLPKPFDFKGSASSIQLRKSYYDNARRGGLDISGLASNRWNTPHGEMGLLVSGSSQTTAYRSDFDVGDPPVSRADILDLNGNGRTGDTADSIIVPTGGGLAVQFGTRNRKGFDAHYQWRPSDTIDIAADAFSYRYRFRLNATLLFAVGDHFDPVVPIDFTLHPNSNIFQSGTWRNLRLDANSFTNDRTSDVSQIAMKARWHDAKWQVSMETVYGFGQSKETFYQLGLTSALSNPDTGATYGDLPTVHQDYSTDLPSLQFGGIDLTQAKNYVFDRAVQQMDWTRGNESSIRADTRYEPENGAVTAFKFGARYADRSADETAIYDYDNLNGAPLGHAPLLVEPVELTLFRRSGHHIGASFWVPALSAIQNFGEVRGAFGLVDATASGAPVTRYEIGERSLALYALADYQFKIAGVLIDGDTGVRVIHTQTATRAEGPGPAGASSFVGIDSNSFDVLPQMNIKASLSNDVSLRAAAYSTLTRQDFDLLSPQVQLDYLFHSGSAGNPALKPMRGKNFDLALEFHRNPRNLTYIDVFCKRISGFVQHQVGQETYFGQAFDVLRPVNGATGNIWGYEIGLTRFLTAWPTPWDGLGLQASYTDVSSSTPSPVNTSDIPLEGLSKTSYNIVLIYEKGPVSGRLAFNWRSRYVITSASASSVFSSDWSSAQGVFDGSVNYTISPHLTASFDIANLGNAQTRTYYADPRLKHNASETDRRITVGLRFSY